MRRHGERLRTPNDAREIRFKRSEVDVDTMFPALEARILRKGRPHEVAPANDRLDFTANRIDWAVGLPCDPSRAQSESADKRDQWRRVHEEYDGENQSELDMAR
jgi:hypothetical protein